MYKFTLTLLVTLNYLVPLDGVQVKVTPARCPTNKIAPHRRRSPYYDQIENRAFVGAFYDLLTPNGAPVAPMQYDPLSSLQEKPQADDPDDCGDIEDYDETDLSSLSQPYTRRGHSDTRFFFGGLFGQKPQTTTVRPTSVRPTYMPVPSYASGGYFGSNYYRPPLHQDPSDHVKPVHEGAHENDATYRPEIVGGPVGHVVGHIPVRPSTRPPQLSTTTVRDHHHTRYPIRPTQATVYPNRPYRPRAFNNNGIFGSFIDLFLLK